MLWLNVHAPFAAFRSFTAGSFRPTAPFITPSAAYGLFLNLAGIEMRENDGKSPMTLIAKRLPVANIAIGAMEQAEHHHLFQQLHNYPIGNSVDEHASACKGNKYNITPVRRAFLSNLRACIGLRGNEALEQQVREGLTGQGPARYGLPFLGDNNFLPDRIDPLSAALPARWWLPVSESDPLGGPQAEIARLTITIDRQDFSRSQSRLFRLMEQATDQVPEAAWVEVKY